MRANVARDVSYVGHTNINVAEHVCSRCRRCYAIQDFPYPREVWWCRDCWRAFKAVQRERRRAQSAAALEAYFATPRRKGWSVEPNRSNGGIAKLPPAQQRVAQDVTLGQATRGVVFKTAAINTDGSVAACSNQQAAEPSSLGDAVRPISGRGPQT